MVLLIKILFIIIILVSIKDHEILVSIKDHDLMTEHRSNLMKGVTQGNLTDTDTVADTDTDTITDKDAVTDAVLANNHILHHKVST